jgi:hypothetical protein
VRDVTKGLGVKRESAVRHLVEMAAQASDGMRWRGQPFDWPLVSMWAAGDLLGDARSLEWADAVLVFDLPPGELPWLALHPAAEWVEDRLRLGKRPLSWCNRPSGWPAWSARHPRVVRFWTDAEGLDQEAVDALCTGSVSPVVEPTPDERVAQLRAEREVARTHLDGLLERYHDHAWRREHKGGGTYPEDHLWRAAQGLREIEHVLDA